MKARSAVLLVAVWALTVTGVAFVTWQVIHTAGRDVLSDSSVPAQAQSTAAAASPTADSVWRPGRPQATHPGSGSSTTATSPSATPSSGGSTPAPSSQGQGSPSGSPHPPSAGPGQGSGHGSHHDAPTSAPPTSPTPPAASISSWRGDAGVVTVSCDPGRIRLLGASPADGYRLEVEQEEDEVQVQFKREDPEDEVEVLAHCVSGVPRFEVEQDDRPHEIPPSRAPLTS